MNLSDYKSHLIAASAAILGLSVHDGWGAWTRHGFMLLVPAVVLLAVAVFLTEPRRSSNSLATFIGLCILFEAAYLADAPIMTLKDGRPGALPFWVGIALASILALAGGVWGWRPLARVWFPAVLTITFLLGSLALRREPWPPIDVFTSQREGAAALLRGVNPYSITMPMTSPRETYPPEVIRADGRIHLGMAYPPLIEFLLIPFYVLGDIRYLHLCSLVFTAALIGYLGPGQVPKLAMCLLLFSPKIYFLLTHAWIEPTVLLMLAITVSLAIRAPRYLWIGIALLFSSKQYFIVAPPLLLLLSPLLPTTRERIRQISYAGVLAVLIALPFLIWDFEALKWSSVGYLSITRPRGDSLGIAGVLAHRGLPFLPDWFAPACAVLTASLCAWKLPRTVGSFCSALAITFLVFFFLNKQAFGNYYQMIIGASAMAIAVSAVRLPHSPACRENAAGAGD
jgi:hypothetical protein